MALNQNDFKEIFVKRNKLLTELEFDKIAENATNLGRPLESAIMEHCFISPKHFLWLLGDYFGMPATGLRIPEINVKVLNIVKEAYAVKNMLVPFSVDDNRLNVAFSIPPDDNLVKELAKIAGLDVQPFIAPERAIKKAHILYKGNVLENLQKQATKIGKAFKDGKEDLDANNDLLPAIMDSAVLVEASDIHIEPYEDEIIIRFRIDGQLKTIISLPKIISDFLTAKLKVMADLRVDERRLPQDGRFTHYVADQEVNIRVSTVPSMWGEKTVMRVLPKESYLYDLTSLGFSDIDLEVIKRYLNRPYGMILVCGPTGSGKTSTLYAFLQEIGMQRIDMFNISSIEDPIEYTIPRVTQIQVNTSLNLTFAAGLRSLLRQDTDVIMVGEIRDQETADIAIRSALVGRLLISSLHTNNAVGAVPRLLNMGIEPYLVASTLNLVIAQRLLRKLCIHCRVKQKPTDQDLLYLREHHDFDYALELMKKQGIIKSEADLEFYSAPGCSFCDYTGYQGRIAIFELLEINDKLRDMIIKRPSMSDLDAYFKASGQKNMFMDGIIKVMQGQTDINEVIRTTV
jgi:type IV pilus assembly protein PilB